MFFDSPLGAIKLWVFYQIMTVFCVLGKVFILYFKFFVSWNVQEVFGPSDPRLVCL